MASNSVLEEVNEMGSMGLDVDELATSVAPAGGSDAVGGALCVIARQVIIILTRPK